MSFGYPRIRDYKNNVDNFAGSMLYKIIASERQSAFPSAVLYLPELHQFQHHQLQPFRQYGRVKSKSKGSTKTSIRLTGKWSMDSSKNESIKISKPSNTSSLERLSLYFKGGDEKMINIHKRDIGEEISKASKSVADTLSIDFPGFHRLEKRPLQNFRTGSKYIGEWNGLGFSGEGLYQYPHGVIYDGMFNINGKFHGPGTLIYPNGQRLEGYWNNGKITKCYQEYHLQKETCPMPDRRYPIEIEKGFGVTGQEWVTNQQPPIFIPEGCYDTIEGIYSSKTKHIINHPRENRLASASERNILRYNTLNSTDDKKDEYTHIREYVTSTQKSKSRFPVANYSEIPLENKIEWIKKFCRSNPDRPVGYQPKLYEVFMAGTKEELEQLEKGGAVKSKYAEKCPSVEESYFDAWNVSFIQTFWNDIREKRKRTFESFNTYRVKKKSSSGKRNTQFFTKSPTSFVPVEGDVCFITPFSSFKKNTVLESKQYNPSVEIADSEKVTMTMETNFLKFSSNVNTAKVQLTSLDHKTRRVSSGSSDGSTELHTLQLDENKDTLEPMTESPQSSNKHDSHANSVVDFLPVQKSEKTDHSEITFGLNLENHLTSSATNRAIATTQDTFDTDIEQKRSIVNKASLTARNDK